MRSSGAASCSRTLPNAANRPLQSYSINRSIVTHRSDVPGSLVGPSPSLLVGRHAHRRRSLTTHIWPFDQAWGTSLDLQTLSETLPQNLFAFSIIPYAGFLYHLTRSKQAPPLVLFGFYFLLVFVLATIPAGIYAKKVYGTTLANVDYLHGTAESLLTLTNLFIVIGLRKGIREAQSQNDEAKKTLQGEVTTPRKE